VPAAYEKNAEGYGLTRDNNEVILGPLPDRPVSSHAPARLAVARQNPYDRPVLTEPGRKADAEEIGPSNCPARGAAVQLDLFCSACHSREPGGRIGGWGGLRLALLRQLLPPQAVVFEDGPALDWEIEHFKRAAAGVDLVIMGEIGEALEDAEQVLVPGAAQDLHIAGPALRTERPEPGEFVATLRGRCYREAAERAHQMQRLALAGLPRVLAEPDPHRFSVLGSGSEQQFFDIARVGPRAHHIQHPKPPFLSRPSLMPTVQSGSLNSVFSVAARSQ
jgi:hypothetical protein